MTMNIEFKTLQENNTWTLVPRPEGKKILTSRWVFKIKRNQDGKIEKYKTRLVAHGHTQQKGNRLRRSLCIRRTIRSN